MFWKVVVTCFKHVCLVRCKRTRLSVCCVWLNRRALFSRLLLVIYGLMSRHTHAPKYPDLLLWSIFPWSALVYAFLWRYDEFRLKPATLCTNSNHSAHIKCTKLLLNLHLNCRRLAYIVSNPGLLWYLNK